LVEEPPYEGQDRLPVIDMPWRQPKGEEFSFIVHNEMEFKAIAPAHRGLAAGRDVLENLVRRNAVIVTHRKRRRVDKGHSCAAAFACVEITTQGDERSGEQFHKARVAAQEQEIGAQIRHGVLSIVMLKCSVVTPREIDQDGHDLTERQRGGTRPLVLPRLKQALRVEGFKVLAKVIDIAEHSNELKLAHRGPLRLMLLRG